MQFAQKMVSLEHGAVRALRGNLRTEDVCEYAHAIQGSWDAAFVQLEGGRLDGAIEFLAGERFVLYRDHWSHRLHAAGAARPGMIGFGIPADAGESLRWWGRPMPRGRIPFGSPESEVDVVTRAGRAVTVLMMRRDDFFDFFHRTTRLDPAPLFRDGHFLALRPEAIGPLRAYWDQLLAHSQRSAMCAFGFADVVSALIEALDLSGCDPREGPCSRGVVGMVLHAAQKSGFEESVPQLSLRLRMSRRTIEYAFHEHLGVAPRAYFARRRLGLCRQELLAADPHSATVTDIATAHGFFELGRFATVYRQFFGELPSESLKKSGEHVTVSISPIRR